MTINKNYIIAGLIAIFVIVLSGVFLCCQTYEPIWIKGIPDEYNMILNTEKMYYDSKDKSGAMPQFDLYMKRLHRHECQSEVFGTDKDGKPNPVIYDDMKLYNSYMKCLLELK